MTGAVEIGIGLVALLALWLALEHATGGADEAVLPRARDLVLFR